MSHKNKRELTLEAIDLRAKIAREERRVHQADNPKSSAIAEATLPSLRRRLAENRRQA